jgi:hypothetical protein
MVYFIEGFVSFFYNTNSALQAWHLPFSLPVRPIIKILPIVPHFGHKPVVTFLGPLDFGFTVFLRTIIWDSWNRIIKSKRLIAKSAGSGIRTHGSLRTWD